MKDYTINWNENIPLHQENILFIFSKSFCPPCKALLPELEKLKILMEKDDLDCKICKIDCEQYPRIAQTYNIRSVPTILLNKKGSIIPFNQNRDSQSIFQWIKNNI